MSAPDPADDRGGAAERRGAAERIFRGAVAACDPRAVVRDRLRATMPEPPSAAGVAERPSAAGGPAVASPQTIVLAAVGKAAPAMAAGALDALGDRVVRGLVVAPDGTPLPWGDDDDGAAVPASVSVLRAAHPVPDERSEYAGLALLALAASVPPDGRFLVLLSGGASALAAVPRDGLTLAEKVARVQALARRGAAIDELNRLRASLSAIKGGRLAAACPAPVMTLISSDVPGDDPSVVGSGPTWPPRTATAAAETETETDAGGRAIGGLSFLDRLGRPAASLGGSGGGRRWTGDVVEVVAGLGRLRAEAAIAARADGWNVAECEAPLEGDVEDVARRIVDEAAALSEGGAWIAGGEWTVALPDHPGRGGRAAQLAMLVARSLPLTSSEAAGLPSPSRDDRPAVTVLVGASDGVDGTGPDAGAIVDGETWATLERAGIDPAAAIARCDAGAALAAIGASLAGGPTGVNHADLVVVLRARHDRHAP